MIPFEVICVDEGKTLPGSECYKLIKGRKYLVDCIREEPAFNKNKGDWYHLSDTPEGVTYHHSLFRRISFQSSKLSEQLASEAMKEVKEVDITKEPEKESV
jgi:hypothetical protein